MPKAPNIASLFSLWGRQGDHGGRTFWDYLRTLSPGRYKTFPRCEVLSDSQANSLSFCPLDECLFRSVAVDGAGSLHECKSVEY